MHTGYWSLMCNRNFALIWSGQTLSQFGNAVHELTLVWLALQLVPQDYWSLGLIIGAKFVPYLFFGLVGGIVSDRANRKRIMIVSDMLRGSAVLLLPLLYLMDMLSLWHLAAVSFVLTALRAFFQPALQASVPRIVTEQHVVAANGILYASYNAAAVLGPVIAGFLFTRVSAATLFLVDSMTFFISALAIVGVRLPHTSASETQPNTVLQDITDTAQMLRQAPVVLWSILDSALAILVVAGILRLGLPVYVSAVLQAQSDVYGLLMGCMGLGTAVGALLVGRMQITRHSLLLFTGWVLYGLLLGSIGLTLWVPVALGLALLTGMAGALIDVMLISVIQLNIPQQHMGKVLSGFSTLANVSESVAGMVMGSLLTLFSVVPVLLGSGVLTALLGGAGLAALLRLRIMSPVSDGETEPRLRGEICAEL
jgi:DHA3 family macrolide efflux protein-like MFS transporter